MYINKEYRRTDKHHMDMPEVVECLIQLHKDIEYRVDKDWLLESIRWNRCLPAASAVGVSACC